jgi:ubiquinone/menaquinone biosynthesis C-methylase UbiE
LKKIKNILRKIFLFESNEVERRKWVEKQLNFISAGKKILDAGCGTQQYKTYCKHLKYHAQDFAKYDGKGDGQGLQKNNWKYGELNYIGDIWKIDEKDNFFDVILCTEVIEHILYPNETIKEFSRLLKPNGTLILTAPVCSIPHFSPYYYYNGFSEYYYKEMARLNSFEIVSIKSNGDAFEYIGGEIFRSISALKNPYRIVFRFISIGYILLLKILSKVSVKHNYLHSGHHVVMKKI